MAKYFRLFNSYPSFTDTFIKPPTVPSLVAGNSLTNPIPNYAQFGSHLKDFFENQMSETTDSGTDYLVAFLASSKGLSSIVETDLTAMANNASVNFGISGDTVGYALLDFRGESWNYIIGDGIIGPSNITNIQAYTDTVNSAVEILNFFKGKYPEIRWAYAGLPHLPKYTCFAPTGGSAFGWSPGLTNIPSSANNHWDVSHPTGLSGLSSSYGDRIFPWANTPVELKEFYRKNSIDRSSQILNASGWLCPDINPVGTNQSKFGLSVHSIFDHNTYVQDLTKLAVDQRSSKLVDYKVMPIFNSLLRSRESHRFDDPSGDFESLGELEVGSVVFQYKYDFISEEGTTSGTGASDNKMSMDFLRAAMLEPSANNNVNGFIYQDNIPLMVSLATTANASPTETEEQAIRRARKFIARELYETNDISQIAWTDIGNEVTAALSYNITAIQLSQIAQAIPIGNQWNVPVIRQQIPDGESETDEDAAKQYRSPMWKKLNAGEPYHSTEKSKYSFQKFADTNPDYLGCDNCPPKPECDRGVCCFSSGGIGWCADQYRGGEVGEGICKEDCDGNFTPLNSNQCPPGVPITCASLGGGGQGEAAPCDSVGEPLGCFTTIPPCQPDCIGVQCCDALGLTANEWDGTSNSAPCVLLTYCSYPCDWCDDYLVGPGTCYQTGNLCAGCCGLPSTNPQAPCPDPSTGTVPFSTRTRKCRAYSRNPASCCCVTCPSESNPDGDAERGYYRRPSYCTSGPVGGGGPPPNGGLSVGGGIAAALQCDRFQIGNAPPGPPGMPPFADPLRPWFADNGCLKPCEDFARVASDLCDCCIGADGTSPFFEQDDPNNPGQKKRCCSTSTGNVCPQSDCFSVCQSNGGVVIGPIDISETLLTQFSEEFRYSIVEDILKFNMLQMFDVDTQVYILAEARAANLLNPNGRNYTSQRELGRFDSTLYTYEDVSLPSQTMGLNFSYNYPPTQETVNRIKSEFAFDRLLIPIKHT